MTTDKLPLTGCRVMVTRPQAQAAGLCALLTAAGADIYLYPTLAIEPAANLPAVQHALQRINDVDMLIFISPNAVDYGLGAIQQYCGELPEQVKTATVGAGSARALAAKSGRAPDVVPHDIFNSEALLAEPAMQDVNGQHIMILRGNGGRSLLADSLRERGADVEYVEVYQRVLPEVDNIQLLTAWQQQAMSYIVVSSGEGLQNLTRLVTQDVDNNAADYLLAALFNTKLVVVNDRLQSLAKQLGFTNDIIVSQQASDTAVVQALISHLS